MYQHIPVLLNEVMTHLDPKPNHLLIDGTVGQGGHAKAFLQRALPDGRLLGIDRDPSNLAIAHEHLASFGDNVILVQDTYANAKAHAYAHGFTSVHAILLDIGFSSLHVDDPSRGFSFSLEGPLDMRYDRSGGLTAGEMVNTWSEDELAKMFRVYGEERNARFIAEKIVEQRGNEPFVTTKQLAAFIEALIPRRGKTHPATKVFQALRISVNDELGELERALPELIELLAPGGRIAIISFHSLEDRIVKQFFKEHPVLTVVTKRPVTGSREELRANPRARSAKLRVAQHN
ncbi:16S rRNA (cytosine(1402)-N(4))-methyltransferase [Candidatus Uhrbacteria bacterium CG_4_9_14_3_um_filter_50_9]|uniref:Ribosomal RNA small subunit methyltransferase H n=1 Tax=Candidatus Uhrbacteria bacterium CG_4_9_14_3_um_filter_50_9 TaxID=1975035 RepID=A0A2M7XBI5_9BACT|nr:MAG: 16S rRNA (cytosine(1402)-N(4))-methyltransferase [Candidatus Uhrbacteria bacterium CG_4_9_14_3_um_filter_50_9]